MPIKSKEGNFCSQTCDPKRTWYLLYTDTICSTESRNRVPSEQSHSVQGRKKPTLSISVTRHWCNPIIQRLWCSLLGERRACAVALTPNSGCIYTHCSVGFLAPILESPSFFHYPSWPNLIVTLESNVLLRLSPLHSAQEYWGLKVFPHYS